MDTAMSFLTMANFLLLSITASDKVQAGLNHIGLEFSLLTVIVLLAVVAFGGTWFVGYLLDQKIKYFQNLVAEQNNRNPQMTEILCICRELEQKK
jgi:hypothetical protein